MQGCACCPGSNPRASAAFGGGEPAFDLTIKNLIHLLTFDSLIPPVALLFSFSHPRLCAASPPEIQIKNLLFQKTCFTARNMLEIVWGGPEHPSATVPLEFSPTADALSYRLQPLR